MPKDSTRDQHHRPPDETPGQPPHSPEWGEDQASGHERQVHHRNYSGKGPGEDGYVGVPPGEEGQYGMRRDDASEPSYNDANASSHSADEADSHHARWREENPAQPDADPQDWKRDRAGNPSKDFEAWRREQTAPGTNVGKPTPQQSTADNSADKSRSRDK